MLRSEKLMPLVAAVEQATGTRPHLSTVIRWATKGCRGNRLEAAFVGGRRFTSVEAVRRFVDAGTEAATVKAEPPRMTLNQASREADRAAARLNKRLGIS